MSESEDIETELLGSWTTSIGPVQDQASEYINLSDTKIKTKVTVHFILLSAHIWKYDGYRAMQSVQDALTKDNVSRR